MSAKSRIKDALETIMTAGEAQACKIYKGNDYDGQIQAYGWWYKPFNRSPGYLGTSVPEALDTIEDIESSRELA